MILEKLEIQSVEVHGKGVARDNGKVVFVENALPGEIIDAEVFQRKKGVSFARPITFHKTSVARQEPFCKHFGVCGGCTWQNVGYESQLEFKRQFVHDAFQRIGKLNFPEIPPVIPCPKTRLYRNKLEFTFSNRNWLTKEEMELQVPFEPALGFHKPGLFDKIVDIKECHLQRDPSNKIRIALKEYAIKEGIAFFDLRKQEGLLRNLIIRPSSLDELLVMVSFFENDAAVVEKVMGFLKNEFPEITSLNYVINPRANDAITDQAVVNYHGEKFIREKLGKNIFRIGAKSFFQVNVEQAEKLFDTALEFAGLKGDETVYDLYCGTGSVSLHIAGQCSKVIGIEQFEDSIHDANENAKLNGISNCEFHAGDVRIMNDDFIGTHGKPDVIFIDPPRAGMHPKMIEPILAAIPEKIIYISCNPSTQARDLALLSDKYIIAAVQPVDMFPQTYHIENVVAMKLIR